MVDRCDRGMEYVDPGCCENDVEQHGKGEELDRDGEMPHVQTADSFHEGLLQSSP